MQTEVKPAIVIESYPEMPEAAQILSKARAYLSDPVHWRKGVWDDNAGGYCAYGAIAHFEGGVFASNASYCLKQTVPDGRHRNVIAYNNSLSTTHADLLAWFDRAIALALEPSNAD